MDKIKVKIKMVNIKMDTDALDLINVTLNICSNINNKLI